jgi:hypothetical protein
MNTPETDGQLYLGVGRGESFPFFVSVVLLLYYNKHMETTSTARVQRLRNERRAAGLCLTCGNPNDSGMVNCIACRTGMRSQRTEREKAYRNRRRVEKLCRKCDAPRVGIVSMCEKHWIQNVADQSLGSTRFGPALLEKLVAQNYQCYYTGMELVPGLASIDHLLPVSRFPELKTDISNVVWCLKKINVMKNDMTESDFVRWCSIISSQRG